MPFCVVGSADLLRGQPASLITVKIRDPATRPCRGAGQYRDFVSEEEFARDPDARSDSGYSRSLTLPTTSWPPSYFFLTA
jgi:hypothetical protein